MLRRASFHALFLLAVLPATLFAAPPRVHFDASTTAECRDVTPAAFADTYPEERIIEATVRVSALLTEGREEDFAELLLVIDSPEKRLRVADFAPKTELFSDVVGTIEAKTSTEKTKNTEFKLGSVFAANYGAASVQVLPSITHTLGQNNSLSETYQRLPSKSLALASGTIHGEHGVFFKLKRSPQNSLEGAKDYTCLFVVPKTWRGDWLVVSVQARGLNKMFLSKTLEECGRAQILVGLYAAGDAEAKAHVERVVEEKARVARKVED